MAPTTAATYQLPPLDPEAQAAELRAYLGERYEERRLVDYDAQLQAEVARIGNEHELYRSSEAYLYNLTAFAMTGTKEPYLRTLAEHVAPPARLLDYGCGIGADGLRLLEAGYRVEFADFANPSTAYLRWRLERRGLDAPVHDLDAAPPGGGFDLAFAFDVIEHVPDPFAFLAALEERARLVLVNLLEPVPGDTELHHDLPVRGLLRHAARHRIRAYARHHGRSHLVLYESAPAGPLARLASRAQLLRGRLAG